MEVRKVTSKYDLRNMDLNEGTSHSLILRQIKPCSSVLEFGCATGYMTKYMKEELACDVCIVELDELSFQTALPFATNSYLGDAMELKWLQTFEKERFDYILFADVLEHLTNPQKVLMHANKLLKEDGKIILSVPNVCHIGILAELYCNKFHYRSLGLLDDTHIHLFSYESLCEMVDNCDNVIEVYDAIFHELEYTEFNAYAKTMSKEVLTYLKSKELSNVYQFIFTLVKREYAKNNEDFVITNSLGYEKKYDSSVYFDYGFGLSEANKVKIEHSVDKPNFLVFVNIPKGVLNLRFDPTEGNFSLIKNLEIYLDHKRISDYATNGEQVDNYILFNTHDPQIFIEDVEDKSTLKITGELQVVSESFVEMYLQSKHHSDQEKASFLQMISAKENELSGVVGQLAEKSERISLLEENILNKEHEIEAVQLEVRNKECQVKALTTSLEEHQRVILEKEEQLGDVNQSLEENQRVTLEKEEQLGYLSQTLVEQQEILENKENELDDVNQCLTELRGILAEKDSEFTELDKALAEYQFNLVLEQTEVESLTTTIEQQFETLIQYSDEIEELFGFWNDTQEKLLLKELEIEDVSNSLSRVEEDLSGKLQEIGLKESQNEQLTRENDEKQVHIGVVEVELAHYQNHYNVALNQKSALEVEKNALAGELMRLRLAYDDINNAFFWKITGSSRKFVDFLKRGKYTGKFIRGIKYLKNHGVKRTIFKIKSKSSKVTNHNPCSNIEVMTLKSIEKPLSMQGKILVHLHLYYIDLAEEYVQYLGNIPFDFDLYITVVDETTRPFLLNLFGSLEHVRDVYIALVENRGRDIAPFLVNQQVLKYDYVCHLHTKKSLYTGTEQKGWRIWLLDSLIGSEEMVRNIFSLLDKSNVGFVYPETYSMIPYWGHTWLKNKGLAISVFERMQIPFDFSSTYLDYPVGSMFWSKVDALRPLFEAEFLSSDFPEEEGQNDGTLAHVIERAFVEVVKSKGYDYAVVDPERNTVTKNWGKKNLHNYWKNTFQQSFDDCNYFPIISFDIFDTLLTRRTLSPDDIFEIVEEKLRITKRNVPFKKWRKEAELHCGRTLGKECNINQIYQTLHELFRVSDSFVKEMLEMELNTELSFCIPRVDMVQLYQKLRLENNKTIILTSDMYLPACCLERLLDKIGIFGYDRLLVSNECNARKDNGSMWEKLSQEYPKEHFVHIGDNEHSDAQNCSDRGIIYHHLMSSYNMYTLTELYRKVKYDPNSLSDKIYMGTIVSKIFNSPFALSEASGAFEIVDARLLGYTMFGPLVLNYVLWLIRENDRKNVKQIVFFARDGYLMNEVFQVLRSKLDVLKKYHSSYVLASRRSLSLISCETPEDFEEILTSDYTGSLDNLFRARFGIEVANKKDVSLSNDKKLILKTLHENIDKVVKRSNSERDNYLEYWESLGFDLSQPLAVCDIGYSGSLQYYLSKLLKKTLDGYYFATTQFQKPLKLPGNTLSAAYVESSIHSMECPAIYRYHLILESVLTSKEGQFVCVGDDGVAKFLGVRSDTHFIDSIQKGVLDFVSDMLESNEEFLLTLSPSSQFLGDLFAFFIENRTVVSAELKNKFLVEDTYCSDVVINTFEHYYRLLDLEH